MSFTYISSQPDDISKIRIRIGDTVCDSGALPDGANFSDEELMAFIQEEGSWQRATAAAFETLAANWATLAGYSASTFNHSQSYQQTQADKFFKLAKQWRDIYGHVGNDQDPNSGVTTPSIQIGAIGMGIMQTL